MSYAGIFQDNYLKTVVEPFQQAFPGVKVNYVPGGTSAQMVGSVRAQKADPQIDVAIMDVTTSSIGNIEGLFEKLAPSEVPALEELYPEARAAGDLKGLLAVSAPPNIQGLALTVLIERMEGGDYRKSIDAAIKKLRALAPSVNTFEPNPDGYSLILNGVVRVATGWNARAQLYGDQTNGKIGTILPPEGSVFQINTINLTAGSKNRAAAVAFINYALSQAAQKAFTERMFYAPTNAKAAIDAAALARTAAAPASRSRMVDVNWNEILRLRDQWNSRWRREVIAASGR